MARLMDVLTTGNCDGKIFAEKYKSLADVSNALKAPQQAAANGNTLKPKSLTA